MKLLILQMLMPLAAWSQQIYTTADKTVPGLTGTYFNQSIYTSTALDLRLFTAPSGTRVDPVINFDTATWGARASVGVTGGNDADWNSFSVQWDGWIDLTTVSRLTLSTDDGSRLWVDLNGDGVFNSTGPEFGASKICFRVKMIIQLRHRKGSVVPRDTVTARSRLSSKTPVGVSP